MSPRRAPTWLYWLPALALMALLFVLSSQSGLRVSDDAAVERPIRFSGHLLAYGVLAALLLWALVRGGRPRRRHLMLAFAIAVVYAVTDELHRSSVPGRSGRIDDVITDALGAVIGAGLAWAVLRRRATTARPGAPARGPGASTSRSVDRQQGSAPRLDAQHEDQQARR